MVRILFVLMSFYLTACTPLYSDDSHDAACRLLKAKIIFNGATINDQQATIENSALPLQERTYDQYCQTAT